MSALNVIATSLTTISAYHLQAIVTVLSKPLVSALNIPGKNAGIYTNKLNILRFLFKIIGCLLECVLCRIALIIFKKSYEDVLDKLEGEVENKRNEIEDAVRNPVNKMISEEEKKADSAVDDLLKPIEDYSNKIDLKNFVELIKSSSGEFDKSNSREDIKSSSVEKRDLKKDEEEAVKIVLKAVKDKTREIKNILNRHKITERTTILENGKKCAEEILKIPEISSAANQGDNILYDYKKFFDDIIYLKQDELIKIMKLGPGTSLQSGEGNIDEDKIEDKLFEVIKNEMPQKLVKYSDGRKRKYKMIELTTEIANNIVENTKEIKEAIESKCESILGTNIGENIKKIGETIIKEGERIKTVVSEEVKDKESEIMIRKIMESAEEISNSILGITSIKEAVDKHATSYTLISTVIEYSIRAKAKLISKALAEDGDLSEIIKEFGDQIGKDSKDLVKTLVKNVIADIIIAKSAEIAKDDVEIGTKINQTIQREIKTSNCKKKIKTVVAIKSRQSDVNSKAKGMAISIVKKEEVAGALKRAATTFGREIKVHKDKITKIIKDTIEKIISDESSCIGKKEGNDEIIREIATRIKTEIKGKLKDNKDEVATMKAKCATPEFRKIVSIIALAGMLATRIVLLWMVHKSNNIGYGVYIIVIIESFFGGMFQTSLLSLAADQSATIRLSIELSSGLVIVVQTVLTKLFYKKERDALIVQLWIVCVLNFLSIILWICRNYSDPIGSMDRDKKPVSDNDYKATLCSPYLMFFFPALMKEFLFPKIVPNALITIEKSLLRSILLPVFLIGGILTAIVIELNGGGNQTYWEVSDCFWAFLGPMIVVSVVSLAAVHTKGCIAMYIFENKPFVVFLCFALLFCYSVMATVSYLGVANYVEKTKEYFSGYIESHSILADIFTFCVSRLSGGYDKLRRDYGLGLNVLVPDAMEPPKPAVFARECLTAAWRNIAKDFKTKVSECL